MDNPGDGIDDLAVLTDLLAALDEPSSRSTPEALNPSGPRGGAPVRLGRVDHVVP